jgi:hypothetical protein
MPTDKPTHREISEPRVSVRYLADYMDAMSKSRHRAGRSVLRRCKYRAIARVTQHIEAQATLSAFICSGSKEMASLAVAANELRKRLASDEFERQLWDHNADYIDRFGAVWPTVKLPKATILPPGPRLELTFGGCKVSARFHFRLQRPTTSNEIRIGAGMLRYAKGKPLPAPTGAWQSAIMLGMLGLTTADENATADGKLCITLDGFSGDSYPAPSNAVTRFKEAQAACSMIAEAWSNIKPPPGAVLE